MKLFYTTILLFFSSFSFAFDLSHSAFDEVLNEVVVKKGHQTQVNYDKLSKDSSGLESYLQEIEAVTETTFKNWSSNDQIAFLINAYNAFTLKLILTKYPDIDSIRDLGGLIFSSPWDIEFFSLFGKKTNLDHIEHGILRKKYAEPRIHFAVNCASKGCPPLLADPYVGNKLDMQLDDAAKLFLTDPERNRFNQEKNRLEISSIFNWFKTDFEKQAGSIDAFIAPYMSDDPKIQTHIRNRGASTRFLDYDWSLNKVE